MAFGDLSTLQDNFNRTNEGPPLSSGYTSLVGGLKVLSNVCAPNTSGENYEYWETMPTSANQEIHVVVPTLPGSGNWICVGTRGNAGWDGYIGLYLDGQFSIYRGDNGSFTKIRTDAAATMSAGDKLGFESATGNSHTVYHYTSGAWNARGSAVVDATYTANGYLFLYIYNSTCRYDDFYGGPFAAAGFGGLILASRTLQSLTQGRVLG